MAHVDERCQCWFAFSAHIYTKSSIDSQLEDFFWRRDFLESIYRILHIFVKIKVYDFTSFSSNIYDVVVVVDIEMDFGKLSDPQALNACLAFDYNG